MAASHDYSETDRITRCEEQQISIRLPMPLIDKLMAAQEAILEAGGGKTSRREIAALCIYKMLFQENVELLEELRKYRTASVESMPLFVGPAPEPPQTVQ